MEEHRHKVEGSYCPSVQCWEGWTWNTALDFEFPVQKQCGETGEGLVKATKMVWGTWSVRRGKGSRADLAERWREGFTSSTGWKETEQWLRVVYNFLKGHYKDDRAKLFLLVPDNIARVNRHELELRRFRLGLKKHSFSRRVMQPWANCQESLYPSVFTGFSCTKPWLSWSSPGDHPAPGKVGLEISKGLFPPALLWFLWFNFSEDCFPMEVHYSPGCHSFTEGKKLS